MIHNKTYEIMKHFLADYTVEIYGRALVGKVPLSQKAIALALDELEKQSILKSRKQGNIKYYGLNLDNSEIKDIILSLELTRKINFLKKQRRLANIFKQDSRIVGIFGSYAKGTQRKGSDVDVFIIGKKQKDDYDNKGTVFDIDISIKYFTENEFKALVRDKNPICKEIVTHHIIMSNIESFINLIWRLYYGFD